MQFLDELNFNNDLEGEMNEFEIGKEIQVLTHRIEDLEKFKTRLEKLQKRDAPEEECEISSYEFEGFEIDENGKRKPVERGVRLNFDYWEAKQWKEFHFPSNEHYSRYWAEVHLINESNGDKLKFYFIEAGSDKHCNTAYPNYKWRHESRNTYSIGFGSGTGPRRNTVDGYRSFSSWIRFRRQNGSGYDWKVWTSKWCGKSENRLCSSDGDEVNNG